MSSSRPPSHLWLSLAASLAACFNSSSYTPVLTSATAGPGTGLQPGSVPTGVTRLFVSGYFLSPVTTVYWQGRPRPTTYFATTPPELVGLLSRGAGPVLQVDLDAEATNAFGALVLTAMGDGTLMSEPLEVFVVDAPFTLTGIAPRQVAANSPATTVILTGTGFNPSSQVFWNGNSLQTTFLDSTRLSAVVPAPLLAVTGDATVQIRETSCRVPDLRYCETVALSTICSVGTGSKVVVPGETTNLAWDATHSLLYAVMQQPSGGYVLAPIDPQTGSIGAGVTVEGPSGLSVSDGDQFIYVASTTSAQRYTLPGLTGAVVFPNLNGPRVVAAPGAPETAAFSNGFNLRILDGTTVRPNAAQAFFEESIVWGFDSSRLYGISINVDGVQTYAVDVSGVTRGAPLGSSRFPFRNDLAFDRVRRRIYAAGGENFDEQGGDPRPFAIATQDQCQLAVDSASGKAFFACAQSQVGLTLRSFDLQTQQQISSVVLSSGDLSAVLDAIRWGSDGLAIAVGSRIYLYSGQFVR